jgi:ankyrin repeat protein
MVENLLARGAKPSEPSEGDKPVYALDLACNNNHADVVNVLCKAGARGNLNLYTNVIKNGFAEVLGHLLRAAPFDASMQEPKFGVSLAHKCAQYNQPTCLKVVLDNGAAVDVLTTRNDSLLHFAVLANSEACVRLLIDRGADPGEIAIVHGVMS